MLLEPLDAEELTADWLVGVAKHRRRPSPQSAQDRPLQMCLWACATSAHVESGLVVRPSRNERSFNVAPGCGTALLALSAVSCRLLARSVVQRLSVLHVRRMLGRMQHEGTAAWPGRDAGAAANAEDRTPSVTLERAERPLHCERLGRLIRHLEGVFAGEPSAPPSILPSTGCKFSDEHSRLVPRCVVQHLVELPAL